MTDPRTIIAAGGAPNLAIDVQPDGIAGTFVLGLSDLDGYDLLGWGAGEDAEWLNIVCDVTDVRTRRGATRLQGPLTRAESGEATIEVLDRDRRFDPLLNVDAIHAGTPLRVRAWSGADPAAPDWTATLFTAKLDDLPVTYSKSGPPRVTLTATDVIADLAAWRAVGRPDPGVGIGDTLLGRVRRVLDELGLPQTTIAADSDTVYRATLAPSTLADAWGVIVDAADAELGRVWVNTANELVVRGRESELSGPVRGTLSDWHGEALFAPHTCYADLDATLGTESVTNRAIAARRVPPVVGDTPPPSAVVQVDDLDSQAQLRRVRTTDRRNLELETDEQLEPWAESLIAVAGRPELRVDRVTPSPWGAGPEAWQAVLATDIGDRWVLRYHPELGPVIAHTVGVLGIEYDITPNGWSIVWTTTPAPTPGDANPAGWFSLGLSELDGGDVLAPFPGVPPASVYGDVDGGLVDVTAWGPTCDGGRVDGGDLYDRPTDGGGPAW